MVSIYLICEKKRYLGWFRQMSCGAENDLDLVANDEVAWKIRGSGIDVVSTCQRRKAIQS